MSTEGETTIASENPNDSGQQASQVPAPARKRRSPKPGSEAAHRIGIAGGTALKAKYGAEYFAQLGAKGGKSNLARNGSRSLSTAGKKGGTATQRSQDPDFYARIGRKGGLNGRGRKKGKRTDTEATSADVQ